MHHEHSDKGELIHYLLDEIKSLRSIEHRLLGIVDRLLPKCGANKVHLVLYQSQIKSQLLIMALTISSNQKVAGILGLVDQVTNGPVVGSFSEITATSDTPAAFTASVDASNNVVVTGVAAGSGTLTVSALCAYTDSTGAPQSQSLSVQIPVTIAALQADAVSLVVNFGTPTPQ